MRTPASLLALPLSLLFATAGCSTGGPEDATRVAGLTPAVPRLPARGVLEPRPPPDAWPLPSHETFADPRAELIAEGRDVFRYDTFGDEAFWGGTLRLHEAIAQLTPVAALGAGLKVDVDALPDALVKQLKEGDVDLRAPATTVALIKLDAVVGVKGFFDERGRMNSIGIQCAMCHSTVDDSFAPGIGARRDGWPNRDLNVGAIVSRAKDLTPFARILDTDEATVRTVLASWGPGRYDAHLLLDGKAFRPDGKSASVLIPPAYGLAGVDVATYTGWGSITYWNTFVAVTQMHGQGSFFDPRLDDARKFPVAARNGFGRIQVKNDRVAPKLAALRAYQESLAAPTAPVGAFDPVRARRGESLFFGIAQCSGCHRGPQLTDANHRLHAASAIGIDSFQADRSPEGKYRTTPLRGLWSHAKGGYYHDGRFANLTEVVRHYQTAFGFCLTEDEEQDLVAYLLSL